MTPNAEFHAWLRTQFTALDGAKEWVRRWYQNGQKIIGTDQWDSFETGYTMRAMAAHVSMALENKEYDGEISGMTSYMDTKYGPDLYREMF